MLDKETIQAVSTFRILFPNVTLIKSKLFKLLLSSSLQPPTGPIKIAIFFFPLIGIFEMFFPFLSSSQKMIIRSLSQFSSNLQSFFFFLILEHYKIHFALQPLYRLFLTFHNLVYIFLSMMFQLE